MQGIRVSYLIKIKNNPNLVVAEYQKDFNFLSKRVFFVTGKKGETRGNHAHKRHSQFMICIQGSCMLNFDNGFIKESILLDSKSKGVEVSPHIWGVQKYLQDNTTLMVLTDYQYDEEDYIRDYQEFKRFITR